MAKRQVNPTRMELTRQKRKLATAIRGHRLLKDKLDELMRQFLELVKTNMALRVKVEEGLAAAASHFVLARAAMPDPVMNTALLAPGRKGALEVGRRNIMSVITPQFTYKPQTDGHGDIYSYGLSFTSSELDDAVKSVSDAFPDMLALAEVEKGCQLIANEVEKTSRRVNALENVMIPEMRETIKFISMKLDENERSAQVRLMKVKDMVLAAAHHF